MAAPGGGDRGRQPPVQIARGDGAERPCSAGRSRAPRPSGSGAGRWAKRPSYTRAENDATPHIHVRQRFLACVNAVHRIPRSAPATPPQPRQPAPASRNQPRPPPGAHLPAAPRCQCPNTLLPSRRRQQHTVRTTVLRPQASRRPARAADRPRGLPEVPRHPSPRESRGLTAGQSHTSSASWASTCGGAVPGGRPQAPGTLGDATGRSGTFRRGQPARRSSAT